MFFLLSRKRQRGEVISLVKSWSLCSLFYPGLFFQAAGLAGQVLIDIAVGLFMQHSIVSLPGAYIEKKETEEQYTADVCHRAALTSDYPAALLL